jgi:hypothetical protein
MTRRARFPRSTLVAVFALSAAALGCSDAAVFGSDQLGGAGAAGEGTHDTGGGRGSDAGTTGRAGAPGREPTSGDGGASDIEVPSSAGVGGGETVSVTGGALSTGGTAPVVAGAAGAADEGCVDVQTSPDMYANGPSIMRYGLDYEPRTKILAQSRLDSNAATESLFWRVDGRGRVLTYAGSGFRHDFTRDERGNVTEFLFTYEDWTDLTEAPSGSAYMSYTCEHTYDDSGLLERSERVDPDLGNATYVYKHDAEGRCESVETPGEDSSGLETRVYENGALTQVIESTPSDAGEQRLRVTDYRYDDRGRLIAREQDGGGHWGAIADGTPDITYYWTYEDDGSWTSEYMDYTTDVPNDSVDGRTCFHRIDAFSAGCAALASQIPRPSGLECRFDDGRELPLFTGMATY